MEINNTIFLKKGKEHSVLRFHPWIFSGAIGTLEKPIESGDWVNVLDSQGNFLCCGHIQQNSIAVRILSFEKIIPDINFWKKKLSEALSFRKNNQIIVKDLTNVYRLVNGEGDGLSGLIIDIYDKSAVMQTHSEGMHKNREIIAQALKEVFSDELISIYYQYENDKESNGYFLGKSNVPVTVVENGIKFLVNWEEGQKTGFFIDQRENRNLISTYAKGKNVLNAFCYTGGFSMYAMKAGASLVHSVDASKNAIEMVEKNVLLNFSEPLNHQAFSEDVFRFLEKNKNVYDLIVLDPPAFAKHQSAKHNAMKGYKRLNALAIENIKKGGIIFTFSCSQVINRELFENTVVAASIIAKRKVRVLHHLSQSPDHPISIFHPEGEYLKGLVLEVE